MAVRSVKCSVGSEWGECSYEESTGGCGHGDDIFLSCEGEGHFI